LPLPVNPANIHPGISKLYAKGEPSMRICIYSANTLPARVFNDYGKEDKHDAYWPRNEEESSSASAGISFLYRHGTVEENEMKKVEFMGRGGKRAGSGCSKRFRMRGAPENR
jgi:hypothetical protein